jgi:hypothetical protein
MKVVEITNFEEAKKYLKAGRLLYIRFNESHKIMLGNWASGFATIERDYIEDAICVRNISIGEEFKTFPVGTVLQFNVLAFAGRERNYFVFLTEDESSS